MEEVEKGEVEDRDACSRLLATNCSRIRFIPFRCSRRFEDPGAGRRGEGVATGEELEDDKVMNLIVCMMGDLTERTERSSGLLCCRIILSFTRIPKTTRCVEVEGGQIRDNFKSN
jgi:hypothetical protein